jgi:hypothetical protein
MITQIKGFLMAIEIFGLKIDLTSGRRNLFNKNNNNNNRNRVNYKKSLIEKVNFF